jgi:hypothetical protein
MTGDCHVRICEGLGVKFPWATRLRNRTTSKIVWQMKCWPGQLITLNDLTVENRRVNHYKLRNAAQ